VFPAHVEFVSYIRRLILQKKRSTGWDQYAIEFEIDFIYYKYS